MSDKINYNDYKEQWLKEINDNEAMTTVEKGRRFAFKLVSQWLDFNEDTDDIFYCDGSGDGGIDLAYLQRDDDNHDDDTTSGHTWYIIQSKYGTSFTGKETILVEAQKAIDTLRGKNTRLSYKSEDIVNRISEFRRKASANDKLVFIIATCDPLSDDEKQALNDVRVIGQAEFGLLFDVDSVSINTIFNELENAPLNRLKVVFNAKLVPSGDDLLVGSIKIVELYKFLKEYKKQTNDLDLIYEKNVRKYLGRNLRVNKYIRDTLNKSPERFGLYNNGITIVVKDFEKTNDDLYNLEEPYIVNGCQTTKTIWGVLDPILDSGGTGKGSSDDWRCKLDKGIVVVKVVKIGESGEELLIDTTRFTNSQTAVTQKDFLALEKNFQEWHKTFAEKYDIYLEIQRGGWDAQKVLQNNSLSVKRFEKWTRAFDLLKIHGAGWMSNPGLSFGKNPPFAPGGSVFKQVISIDYCFSIDNLYAAYLLNELTIRIKFGYGVEIKTRGQTKFLFCFVIIELLKFCMEFAVLDTNNQNITKAAIKIFSDLESDAAKRLYKSALNVIDDYLSSKGENSVFNEDSFKGDLNAFLKNDKLGRKEFSKLLNESIILEKKSMKKDGDLEIIENVIKDI